MKTQRERPREDEAERRAMRLQAKECRRVPANHGKLGQRPGSDSPSQPKREKTFLGPVNWNFRKKIISKQFTCDITLRNERAIFSSWGFYSQKKANCREITP